MAGKSSMRTNPWAGQSPNEIPRFPHDDAGRAGADAHPIQLTQTGQYMKRPFLVTAALVAAAVAVLLCAGATAADGGKTPAKRFTAEHVFDIEYATDPQVSPNGKTIVYVRHAMDKLTDRDIGGLWSIDVASGAHRPLVTGQPASSPRFSPDGSRLLYTASAEGRPELRLLYLESGRSFSLAQFTDAGPAGAAWSPDGERIAF